MLVSGSCYLLFAYDLGFQIDLEQSERLLSGTSERITIVPRHRAPKHFEYRSKPLRIKQRASPLKVLEFNTLATVDLVIFDIGTVSLTYRIPFEATFQELLELSDVLYDNEAFLKDSSSRVEELMQTVRSAVFKPMISESVEDYLIFEITKHPGDPGPNKLLADNREVVAHILRSEKLPLSEQEISEALAEPVSYTPDDTVIINWNASFIYGEGAEDVRAILEFANVQLLEMRFLDKQLDTALEQSYDIFSKRPTSALPWTRRFENDLNRIAQLQADGALLFEGVSNALKLLGDQYLSKVYRLAARRLYLADWDRTITRKLGALESIYQKLEDMSDTMRMELLEIIIIVLILVSIILPFFAGK